MLQQIEVTALLAIRRHTAHPLAVRAARMAGLWGEHALGWIALGAIGVIDSVHRPLWFGVSAAAVVAHGAGIVIKRLVRRRRPADADLPPLCHTPSELSFPSAHACSTTAAAIALVPILGLPAAVVIISLMGFSRLLLGVHYPTDVLAGVAVGGVSAAIVGQLALML